MSENNLPNIEGEENVTPVAEEVVDEAAEAFEEVAEAAEEVTDEVADEEDLFEGVDFEEGLSEEDIEYVTEQLEELAETKSNGRVIKLVAIIVAAVIAGVAALGAIVGALIGFDTLKEFDGSTLLAIKRLVIKNPYNEMGYINLSGRTIADIAEASGMELEQFLADYGLPADMPADTEEAAAYYNIPVSVIAEKMYGIDTATVKELLQLGDDVTDSTPWGEAEGKATLSAYIGDENLEMFKEQYGLGDDITGETRWGEIRSIIDQKTLEMQQASEAEMAAAVAEATAE